MTDQEGSARGEVSPQRARDELIGAIDLDTDADDKTHDRLAVRRIGSLVSLEFEHRGVDEVDDAWREVVRVPHQHARAVANLVLKAAGAPHLAQPSFDDISAVVDALEVRARNEAAPVAIGAGIGGMLGIIAGELRHLRAALDYRNELLAESNALAREGHEFARRHDERMAKAFAAAAPAEPAMTESPS